MRLWQSRSTASSYPQYGRKVEIAVQALHVHGIGPGRLEPGTLLPKKRRACDWWTTVRASPTYHQDDPSTQDMTEEAPYMTTIIRVRCEEADRDRQESGLGTGSSQELTTPKGTAMPLRAVSWTSTRSTCRLDRFW